MNIKDLIWNLTHRRQIARFAEQCQIGAILEHSHGDQWEIVKRGELGCFIRATDAPMATGGIMAIFGVDKRDLAIDWPYGSRHFKVVRSPGESVEEAMRVKMR